MKTEICWVNIKDDLPQDHVRVLIAIKRKSCINDIEYFSLIFGYCTEKGEWLDDDGCCIGDVFFWTYIDWPKEKLEPCGNMP